MNWADAIIIVILVLAGLRGFQVGAAAEALAVTGIWLGIIVGVLLVPPVAGLTSGTARALVALLVICACTLLLGGVGVLAGQRVHRLLARNRLRLPDAVVGVAVGVVAAVFAVWVLGTVLSSSRFTALNSELRDSTVLRAVDRVLPPLPEMFARVESFLSKRGYPVVFINLPPGLIAPADLPDDATIQAAFQAARASTVKISGESCGMITTGSGFVAAPGLVVTNAHVVAGETRTQVIDSSGSHLGAVVVFDPGLDVAVLRVPGLNDPALPIRDEPVARDTTAAIMGYPEGGPLHAEPAAVNSVIEALGLNIYGTGTSDRTVYELNGDVWPGNSGGPLVATGQPAGTTGLQPGTVIGLIFASSTTTPHIAYALTMGAVTVDIVRAESSATTTSTGACLP